MTTLPDMRPVMRAAHALLGGRARVVTRLVHARNTRCPDSTTAPPAGVDGAVENQGQAAASFFTWKAPMISVAPRISSMMPAMMNSVVTARLGHTNTTIAPTMSRMPPQIM